MSYCWTKDVHIICSKEDASTDSSSGGPNSRAGHHHVLVLCRSGIAFVVAALPWKMEGVVPFHDLLEVDAMGDLTCTSTQQFWVTSCGKAMHDRRA